MSRTRFALAATLIFLLLGLAAPVAQAQILQAELKVKGLACPFCAYGLERKLKKLPGAKALEVVMNDNIARVQFDQEHSEQSPAVDEIPKAVHDAGFELGELRLTVLAKRSSFEGQPSLLLPGGEQLLIKTEDRGRALAEEVAESTRVKATGVVRRNQHSSHHGHPYTIEVESFQVKERKARKHD